MSPPHLPTSALPHTGDNRAADLNQRIHQAYMSGEQYDAFDLNSADPASAREGKRLYDQWITDVLDLIDYIESDTAQLRAEVKRTADIAPSRAVFSPEEVRQLWRYQFGPFDEKFPQMHPFTCGQRDDHPEVAGDKGVLVPTVRGWICPFCNYTQHWAHGFMLVQR